MSDLRHWAKEPEPRPSPTGTLAYLAAGVLIWGAHFMGAYATHTLSCRLAFSQETTRWIILIETALTLLLTGLFLLRLNHLARFLGLSPQMERRDTYDAVARIGLILALMAVAWTGTATALLSTCS